MAILAALKTMFLFSWLPTCFALQYKGFSGALARGYDVIPPGNYTTAQAEEACTAAPTCIGFTWELAKCTSGPGPVCTNPVLTYFRDNSAHNTDNRWYWYTNGRPNVCAFPTLLAGSSSAQIVPPANNTAEVIAAWRNELETWRQTCAKAMNFSGSIYDVGALKWTQSSYIQPQSHPYDRFLWDPIKHAHTVDKFVKDLRERYGGVDSILIWPTYTNIGIDDRNQFDMIRSMPGGITGITQLVTAFHAVGVKVLLPYHPWDVGTRRELCGDTPGPLPQEGCTRVGDPMADEDAMAALQVAVGADGFNGDTMGAIPREFYDAAVARHHIIALEPEGHAPFSSVNYDTLDWGEGWRYTVPPMVDTMKWLTRGRHQVNICDRWRQNKAGLATTALFNGIGMESWENVWGTWNGITPRDAQIYTRVSAILRFAGGHELGGSAQADAVSNRSLLQSQHWSPFSPEIVSPSRTYASTFTSNDGSEALVTVVSFASGSCGKFVVDERFRSPNFAFFDLWHGSEIEVDASSSTVCVPLDDSIITTLGQCGSNPDSTCAGFGALLITNHSKDATLQNFLHRMRGLSATKLADYRCEGGPTCVNNGTVNTDPWPFFPTCNASVCAGLSIQAVPKTPTKPHTSAPNPNAIKIAGGEFLFSTTGVMIEGDTAQGVDIQFPFDPTPRKVHSATVQVPSLWVNKYPVTNDNFATFLAEAQYKPADAEHFLQHWLQGKPRPGWGNKPVTFVSLNDARAYCTYYGQRLPEVAEWQWLAGQHANQTALYPWGDDPPSNETAGGTGASSGNIYNGPRDVDALPAGCSAAGVCDLIGNTWEMSTEFHDQHTRSVVLLGGSNYRPSGSMWYFPQAWQIGQHEKYMLYSDGYERAATIGFRCVADADDSSTEDGYS